MLTLRAFYLSALILLFTAIPTTAQDKLFTLDDLYHPDATKRINLNGELPRLMGWLDNQHYLQRKSDPETGPQLLKVNAQTGQAEPFYDSAKMMTAFARLPGLSADDAKRIALGMFEMNAARTAALINFANDLFYYQFGSETVIRLTNTADEEVGEDFSPDGKMVAYVRNYNLWIVDVATQKERSLTLDGHAKLFNGRLDWVYQEELYGRGDYKAFWWSPDSARITYLQLDETRVKDFTVVDHIPNQQNLEIYAYPKSGMPNPTVRLGIVKVAGGETRWADLFKYENVEPLIVRVDWKPDSSKIIFYLQNREQTWLDLNFADPVSGKVETAFRETSQAWVERDNHQIVHWMKDGSFIWTSERTGYKHIYHISSDCKQVRAITSGQWEARNIHGVDEANSWIYFSGTERSPIASDVYRIKLDGSGLQRLSEAAGSHNANFNDALTHYLDTWGNAWTPTQIRLHSADGKVARVIEENKVEAIKQFKLAKPEFLQVKTRDGFLMEAMMIKPPDFDPRKKYPVFQHTYSGPHAQQVRNAWQSGAGNLWHQLLAQKGYIVWICDNRSASGKGMTSAFAAYKQLGVVELQDLEDGVSYLKTLPYVDSARIGLNGWSYGGFMTAYALTHSTMWKAGISGAPVTDWNLYDTIYTERYMGTPQNNAEGYDKTSVVKAAKNLNGKLLLIHGTIDDNVHMQNSIQFIYELQRAGKQFELMVYPKSRHGVGDPRLVRHMREKMLTFILENL